MSSEKNSPFAGDRGLREAVLPLDDSGAGEAKKPPSKHAGHRQRLRDRFLADNGDTMPDYELLELILFSAVPRKDTKGIAKALIAKFGDFEGVISAEPARLREVPDVKDAIIAQLKVIETAAQRLTRSQIKDKTVLSSWSALMGYCKSKMARLEREEFRILFLDRKNVLIADEAQGRGTVDHVPVYPREIMKRALELNASAIILAHNHPSGDPTPSRADIEMTKQIVAVAKPLGVTVHDHVIIAREMDASFKALGLL